MLTVREKALRDDQMQVVFGPSHGDIEQPTFFFDLCRRSGAEVRRHAAVDHIEHEHRFPLLTFGGVDRRQDQIVLVEQGNAGLVAGGVGRIERQFGEEAFSGRIGARNLLELDKVGAPDLGILMDSFQMRLVP